MLLRILTALVLIPIVVALVWWGPHALLAGLAGIVTILALVEFFTLGNRVGLRAYQKWTLVCVAGLFYAQYSQEFVETHAIGEGISLVRSAQGGVLSVEAILLVFVFGCVCLGLLTRTSFHFHQRRRPPIRRNSVQLFSPPERHRARRPPTGSLHPLHNLGW
jgi:CDP-diglyceride synthetase